MVQTTSSQKPTTVKPAANARVKNIPTPTPIAFPVPHTSGDRLRATPEFLGTAVGADEVVGPAAVLLSIPPDVVKDARLVSVLDDGVADAELLVLGGEIGSFAQLLDISTMATSWATGSYSTGRRDMIPGRDRARTRILQMQLLKVCANTCQWLPHTPRAEVYTYVSALTSGLIAELK